MLIICKAEIIQVNGRLKVEAPLICLARTTHPSLARSTCKRESQTDICLCKLPLIPRARVRGISSYPTRQENPGEQDPPGGAQT